MSISDINSSDYNPFLDPNLEEKLKDIEESVKKKTHSIVSSLSSSTDINNSSSSSAITVNSVPVLTLGDETVQSLLKEQEDPIILQEKLKALFSVENDTKDPYPINARELHEFLGVMTAYKDWFPRMINKTNLLEGQDFNLLKIERVQNEGNRQVKREIIEHSLTLDAAKIIAMVQNSALGNLVRRYLIWAEKKLREIVPVVQQQTQVLTPAQAILQIGQAMVAMEQNQQKQISALTQVDQLQQEQIDKINEDIKILQDRVNAAASQRYQMSEALKEDINYEPLDADGDITVKEMADILKQKGYDVGQNRLFDWMVRQGFIKRLAKGGYTVYKRYSDIGVLVTKEKSSEVPAGFTAINKTVNITKKGKRWLYERYGMSQAI